MTRNVVGRLRLSRFSPSRRRGERSIYYARRIMRYQPHRGGKGRSLAISPICRDRFFVSVHTRLYLAGFVQLLCFLVPSLPGNLLGGRTILLLDNIVRTDTYLVFSLLRVNFI